MQQLFLSLYLHALLHVGELVFEHHVLLLQCLIGHLDGQRKRGRQGGLSVPWTEGLSLLAAHAGTEVSKSLSL